MKFGILGAMPHEVALMARTMSARRSVEVAMRTFFEGTWAGQEVVLVLSRVGKVSAAITTLVFTGVAGAIDPDLRIGDIVIAESLVQHDMDASPLPAFKRFEIPLLGKIFFETGLCNEACDAAIRYTQGEFLHDVTPEKRAAFGMDRPRVFRGLVASGDQFLADPRKAAELREALPGLLCTEMEGAAVAQVCHEMGGIPNAIIRVISDQSDHSAAVDFMRFVDEVAEYLTGGIVRSLLSSFSLQTHPPAE
jgi:adenosylhomocysteine nucleosidase